MLEDVKNLSIENNKILHKLRNTARLATIWRIFYWIVIIGLTFGSFYFIQPYIEQLKGIYSGFSGDVGAVKNVTGQVSGVTNLLKGLGQ